MKINNYSGDDDNDTDDMTLSTKEWIEVMMKSVIIVYGVGNEDDCDDNDDEDRMTKMR